MILISIQPHTYLTITHHIVLAHYNIQIT